MKIERLNVNNFKSLRSVAIHPGALSVVIGPNASGKSNLVEALAFLADIYRNGVELAVAKLGGFENIAFRRQRRTKLPITLSVRVQMDDAEFRRFSRRKQLSPHLIFEHTFSLKARGGGIRAEFFVSGEKLSVWSLNGKPDGNLIVEVTRDEGKLSFHPPLNRAVLAAGEFADLTSVLELFSDTRRAPVADTELLLSQIGRFVPYLSGLIQSVSKLRVFQLSPRTCREFGVPTPRPELDRYGNNLPAVVDSLQKGHPREWEQVLRMMRHIVPTLQAVSVDYTHSRTLGIFFHEEGVSRPWTVGEVSDGTIQSLAMFAAVFDPSSTFIVIEEPENSVHPWIVRNLIEACRLVSKSKQILLTTHSLSLLNVLEPNEIWVASRMNGETRLQPLTALYPEFEDLWKNGVVSISEMLDSGALLEFAPGRLATAN